MNEYPVLTCDRPEDEGCNDYTLNDRTCWISVGKFSVHIKREGDEEGDAIAVEVFPLRGSGEPIGGIYADEEDIQEWYPEEEEDPK